MSITTRPIGLPYPEPSLATWWPKLDFEFEDAAAAGHTATATAWRVSALLARPTGWRIGTVNQPPPSLVIHATGRPRLIYATTH